MSYNTYPQNPFPPNSENAGGGGSPYVLPIASAETLGGVKVGNGLSINENGVLSNPNPTPYAPINYSTTEQATGQKWIDGKDIFCKTVDCGYLPDNSSKLVATDLSNVTVVKIDGVAIGDSSISLPHISTNNVYIEISFESSNDIFIRTNGYFSTMQGYVTLYYTKTESEV